MKLYLLWYDDYGFSMNKQLKGVYGSTELAQKALIDEAPKHVYSWSTLAPLEQIKSWMYLSFYLEEVELDTPHETKSEYIELDINDLLNRMVGIGTT